MSERALEQLRAGYDALWRDGDLDAGLAGIGDDFEWVVPHGLDSPVRRGRDEIREFFEQWFEVFEDPRVDYEFVDAGDRVVVLCVASARGGTSGAEVETRFGQVWILRDGRFVRMEWYDSHAEALEAAGLEPEEDRA